MHLQLQDQSVDHATGKSPDPSEETFVVLGFAVDHQMTFFYQENKLKHILHGKTKKITKPITVTEMRKG